MATVYSGWKWNTPGTVAWRVAVDYSDAATSTFKVRVEVTGGSLWMKCTCKVDGSDSGWGTKTYSATSGFTFGTTGSLSRGSSHTFSVTCSGGSWGQNGTLSVTISALNYSVGISHWTWGYKNGEGNNGDKTAYKLGDTSFSVSANSNYTMDASRAVTVPKGFSLDQQCGGSSYASSWTTYSFPATFKADRNAGFEYDYRPISYSITYTMNGGTNASSNPSSYNVLYGVTFANPSRTGYTFKNWTIDGSAVTGINPGANATFSSPDDLRTKTNSRTIGNKTVVANWTANTYTVTLNQQSGSGGTTSVQIAYDTAKGSYPTITKPTRTGYTFKGYYTGTNGTGTQYYDANGNSTRAFQIASNTTWYAYWTINSYNVAYNANGGTSTPTTQSANYGSSVTLANAIQKNNTDTNVTITITYNANGGSGAPGNSTGTAVNTTPYTFNKWALNSTSGTQYAAGASYTIPASNSTMYATWTTGTTTRKSNPSITLSSTKPTRDTYDFLGWSTSSTATTASYAAGTAYTFSANTTLYAVWKKAINAYYKVGGAWKGGLAYIKVNGTWKQAIKVYYKVGGAWKEFK